MSVEVQIGSEKRSIDDSSPSWINDQINRRRRDGIPVCVQVYINKESINLRLSTPGCSGGGGGGSLNTQEMEIVDLWRKHHLSEDSYTGGNLISFLKQIAKWFR